MLLRMPARDKHPMQDLLARKVRWEPSCDLYSCMFFLAAIIFVGPRALFRPSLFCPSNLGSQVRYQQLQFTIRELEGQIKALETKLVQSRSQVKPRLIQRQIVGTCWCWGVHPFPRIKK